MDFGHPTLLFGPFELHHVGVEDALAVALEVDDGIRCQEPGLVQQVWMVIGLAEQEQGPASGGLGHDFGQGARPGLRLRLSVRRRRANSSRTSPTTTYKPSTTAPATSTRR